MTSLLALLIALLAFIAIARKALDARLVFVVAGLLLASVAGSFGFLQEDFGTPSAVHSLLFSAVNIALSFAFAGLVKGQGYTRDTLDLLRRTFLRHDPRAATPLISLAVVAALLSSLALLSANSACAVVAPVVAPLLAGLGISPSLASAAIVGGAWGAIVSPGDINANAIQSALKSIGEPELQVTSAHILPAGIAAAVIIAIAARAARRQVAQANPPAVRTSEHNAASLIRGCIPLVPFLVLAVQGIFSRLSSLSIPVPSAVTARC